MDNQEMVFDRQWLRAFGVQDNPSNELTIVKSRITIEGLDRVYRFWQLSDLHVSFAFPNDPQDKIEQAMIRGRSWSQASGQNSLYMLDKLIDEANTRELDGIVICGDLIDYYSHSNMRYMQEKLSKLRAKAFYALGNHEGSDGGAYIDSRRYYEEYDKLTDGASESRIVDFGKFLLLVIDDSDLKIRREQIEVLEKANACNKPILLAVHIPLLTEGLEPSCMERWGTSFMLGTKDDSALSKEFCEKVKDEQSNVKAILAGHIHYENVSKFRSGHFQFCNAPALMGFIREIEICPE